MCIQICIILYLQGFRVQARNYTVLLLSLHCGTWDMYPVAVPLNAPASIVELYMYICIYMYIHVTCYMYMYMSLSLHGIM